MQAGGRHVHDSLGMSSGSDLDQTTVEGKCNKTYGHTVLCRVRTWVGCKFGRQRDS